MLVWRLPLLHRHRRLIESAVSVQELAEIAKKKVPKSVFDYVEGSALHEISSARSNEAYRRVEFQPSLLKNVADIDTTTKIFGKEVALPIIFAPTGYTRMMHYSGESAVARVAAAKNMIYCLSTMGTTSPEELARDVPESRRWFQVYVMRNREDTVRFVTQAKENGYEALVLTLDTKIPGIRLRDLRNGLTVPPRISFSTFLNMARKPRWWMNLLTTPPLEFAAFRGWTKSLADAAALIFDPTIGAQDVTWLRSIWDGPIVVKGVQTVEDAVEIAGLGVEAIVISNHGGRQLDRGPVPLEVLEDIVNAVDGKADVYIDGGILSGQDVYAALALGAKGVMIGRAYLYGIMAGGENGVDRVVELMRRDLVNTMGLTGVRTIDEIRNSKTRLRPLNS
ncbi:MAG: alpha-hydroxy-acid oxidizing protein [Actinobacteria bacterium]|nr:alpha-hydroxy-acid oxidizing protein [Actinomycetota bacterium]